MLTERKPVTACKRWKHTLLVSLTGCYMKLNVTLLGLCFNIKVSPIVQCPFYSVPAVTNLSDFNLRTDNTIANSFIYFHC